MGITLFERWSPEYALHNACQDVKKDGVEGLKKHLTSNALKTVESIQAVAENPAVSLITAAIKGSNQANILLEKLSECEWSLKDMIKGKETAKAIVRFDYQDQMTGTVELKMIREKKIWKIDGLGLPKFEKLALPQEDR